MLFTKSFWIYVLMAPNCLSGATCVLFLQETPTQILFEIIDRIGVGRMEAQFGNMSIILIAIAAVDFFCPSVKHGSAIESILLSTYCICNIYFVIRKLRVKKKLLIFCNSVKIRLI